MSSLSGSIPCCRCAKKATRYCETCKLCYCEGTCDDDHQFGKLKTHDTKVKLSAVCERCKVKEPALFCFSECVSAFCTSCWNEHHAKGTLQEHNNSKYPAADEKQGKEEKKSSVSASSTAVASTSSAASAASTTSAVAASTTSTQRTVSSEVLRQALEAIAPTRDCAHNGYRETSSLADGMSINALGQSLPFVGRTQELKQFAETLSTNIKLWRGLRAAKTEDEVIQAKEAIKREWRHPAVAGQPGSGKTTLMQRGYLQVSGKLAESSGRHFAWDAAASPLEPWEFKLLRQCPALAQAVLAARIFHQAVNGRYSSYQELCADLLSALQKHGLDLSDLTLKSVLEHIGCHSQKPPTLVGFNLSETQKFFEFHARDCLQHLMSAAYTFSRDSPTYMLCATFEGSHRRDLYESFVGSGVQCEVLPFKATIPLGDVLSRLVSRCAAPASSSSSCSAVSSASSSSASSSSSSSLHQLAEDASVTKIWEQPLLQAALQDITTPRIFSVFLHVIGCDPTIQVEPDDAKEEHVHTKTSFSVRHFFTVLCSSPSFEVMQQWLKRTREEVSRAYPHYLNPLRACPIPAMMTILAFDFLCAPLSESAATQPITGSTKSWESVEQDGVIFLESVGTVLHVHVPLILLSQWAAYHSDVAIVDVLEPFLSLRPKLESREIEKIDAVMIALRLLLYQQQHPGETTFTPADILPELKGDLAHVRLNLPEPLMFRVLQGHFDPDADMEPGIIYVGCGNDNFADSWGAFERAGCSSGSSRRRIVSLCMQSKRRQNRTLLKADHVNEEVKKVKNRVDNDLVFVLVGDYVNLEVEPDDNEVLYTKENMQKLYGERLTAKRCHALQNLKSSHPQPLFAPSSSSSSSSSIFGPLFGSPARRS